MPEFPIRLQPGADLRRSIEEIGRARFPNGGFVVCGIGSLSDPRLRLADNAAETRLDGPYEMLTLSGTVSPDGAHLHMSIASPSGAVLGGHVVHGNRVRTTVELLLVGLSDWALRREADAETGFLELSVRPLGEWTSTA